VRRDRTRNAAADTERECAIDPVGRGCAEPAAYRHAEAVVDAVVNDQQRDGPNGDRDRKAEQKRIELCHFPDSQKANAPVKPGHSVNPF
jgi:hypothetical protein